MKTRTEALADYENALMALDEALDAAQSVVPRQDGEDNIELFSARIDALRLQLYVVNETLGNVLRASLTLPKETACDQSSQPAGSPAARPPVTRR